MRRLLPGRNEPRLHAESFLFDQQCKSLLASTIRPVRHSAPLQLSCHCKAQEVSLIDSWRADSQSLSMALARNYPMCKNAETLNRDRRIYSSKTRLVAQRAIGFNLVIELKNIILRRVSIF